MRINFGPFITTITLLCIIIYDIYYCIFIDIPFVGEPKNTSAEAFCGVTMLLLGMIAVVGLIWLMIILWDKPIIKIKK